MGYWGRIFLSASRFSNPATPGSCGFGDYIFQMDYSTNESQGDCCGEGFSPYGGFAISGGAFLDAFLQ